MTRPLSLIEWLASFVSEASHDKLDRLANQWSELPPLAIDSRRVSASDIFLSMPVADNSRRHEYVKQALSREVQLCLVPATWAEAIQDDRCLGIESLDERVGEVISRYWGDPSQGLQVIGITGTNGKSSTAFFVAQMLSALHQPSGIIGTLGYGPIHQLSQGIHTTPDNARLHSELAEFEASGLKAVAMEVSSHSLDQGRVLGVHFDTAVFTNLTRDHLDYHGTMEAYGDAKAKLFQWPGLKRSVINIDDAFGRTLVAKQSAQQRRTYSLNDPSADFSLTDWEAIPKGVRYEFKTPWGNLQGELPLIGRFNLANVLAALAAIETSIPSLESAQLALAAIKPVPGRMELILPSLHRPLSPQAVVDYSHTPDALEQALNALKPHVKGKLHVVMGCGGDRDAGKRSVMGEIAARLADVIWITNDNPRSENPDTIIQHILAGMNLQKINRHKACYVEPDRGKAIARALYEARAEDCVLIAGKGHEDYQEIQGQRIPFSDRQSAQEILGHTF